MKSLFLFGYGCSLLLAISLSAAEADFKTASYSIGLSRSAAAFTVFSIDSLGKGKLDHNPVLADTNDIPGLRFEAQGGGEFAYSLPTSQNGASQVWVQVPAIAGSNDYIWAYWGKSGAAAPTYTTNGTTWETNYYAVWHLGEDQAGTGSSGIYKDATTNHHHGDDYISATGTSGLVDGGQQFDGVDDRIAVGLFHLSAGLTFSAWVRMNRSQTDGRLYRQRRSRIRRSRRQGPVQPFLRWLVSHHWHDLGQ